MGNEIILVTGNGFDLYCNLESRFSDFIVHRFAQYNEIISLISKSLQSVKDIQRARSVAGFVSVEDFGQYIRVLERYDLSLLNFWDIYFLDLQLSNSKPDWSDVEDKIRSFILNLKWNGSTYDYWEHFGYNVNAVDKTINSRSLVHIFFSEILRIMFRSEISTNSLYNISKIRHGSAVSNKTFETYYQFLLSELNRFEFDFQSYLLDQMSNKIDEYGEYSIDLYDLITENVDKEKIYLMNFNYTLPAVKSGPRRGANVHGYIGYGVDTKIDSIIIGVDLSGVDLTEEQVHANIHMFTKTSRKLDHKQSLTVLKLPLKGSVRKIIFFGHSLSSADYSYFQSLFDYYDLYESDVILEFLYSQYVGKTKEEIEYECKTRVQRLIRAYGLSMDNRDRGNNLLHKLLLESRIIIREIKQKELMNENGTGH